ncbi:MAG: amidohydrolase family protein [Actinomycetota bacterium]|nr:amidohydrolase family protein [Actinomycetota bacterium]
MRTLYLVTRVATLTHPAVGEWLLVDERHVERVGTGEPPAADRVVDLPGTTILPGFIDSHVHLTGTGIDQSGPALDEARSAEALVATVAREAATGREGALLCHGFDETTWDRPHLPSIGDLDRASDDPLIVVRADGHISLANSAALRQSGVLGMRGVETDDAGEPTGVVRQEANWALQRWFHESLSDREVQEYQLRAAALAASRGITSVHEMAIPNSRGPRDFEVLMTHRDRLPVDTIPYVASMDIPFVMDFALPRIGGDLSLDGSLGARTAYLSRPYVNGEGRGVGYIETDELVEFFHNAHLAGLQVGVHAIGDAAIEQSVSSWERVYSTLDSRSRRHFRARRHRIEHFELPTPDHVERAAALGLTISVQPAFDATWGQAGGMYEQRLGEERAAGMNPFRTLMLRGLVLGAGSDSPVTALDPMEGIAALESHHDPLERLSREEALRLFTQGSAALAHLDDKKGRLEPGFHADFAAYEEDPTAAASVRGLRPVLTVSMGREVYAR